MAKKQSKKVASKKSKLKVAEVRSVAPLSKDEMEKIESLLASLKDLKESHTYQVTELRANQAKVAKLQAEIACLEIEIAKAQITGKDEHARALRVEKLFNEKKLEKETVIADICEKRGIAVQEIQYNPATGEVVNFK